MALDAFDSSTTFPSAAPAPAMAAPSSYPAWANFEMDRRRNRWWAFPVLGGIARLVALIPHIIVLALLGILFGTFGSQAGSVPVYVMGLAFWVLWIPVLFTGHYASWGYGMVGGYLRWSTRVGAFALGITDHYPPFSMRVVDHPVEISFSRPESHNRWWAVPLLGYVVKMIILIPHFFCLTGLGLVAVILYFTMWIPVLFTGSYPEAPYGFMCGLMRWSLRVLAYLDGLIDRYPPFSFS